MTAEMRLKTRLIDVHIFLFCVLMKPTARGPIAISLRTLWWHTLTRYSAGQSILFSSKKKKIKQLYVYDIF